MKALIWLAALLLIGPVQAQYLQVVRDPVATGGGGSTSGTINSAASPQVAYYTGASAISGDAGLTYNASTAFLTLNGGLLVTSATGTVSATFVYAGGVSGTQISATQSLYGPSLQVGGLTVSTTVQMMNKQTGTSSINGMATESPAGVRGSIHCDSTNCLITRNGATASGFTIGAAGVGLGSNPVSGISLSIPGITSTTALTVSGAVTATALNTTATASSAVCTNGAGTIISSSTAGCIISAPELKQNLEPLEDGILEKLMLVQPVRYDFGGPQIGLISHDYEGLRGVERQFPELIVPGAGCLKGADCMKGTDGQMHLKYVNYPQMNAVLIKAIQELTTRVELLERR